MLASSSDRRGRTGLTAEYRLLAVSHVGLSCGHPEHTPMWRYLAPPNCSKTAGWLTHRGALLGPVLRSSSAHLRLPERKVARPAVQLLCRAKLHIPRMTVCYHDAHKMPACNGVLANHESPWRGESFVTRKTPGGAAAYLETGTRMRRGGVDARRERYCVEAMSLKLRQSLTINYVAGTCISRPVRDLIEHPFFQLAGLHWRDHVALDAACAQPTDEPKLLADPSKANGELTAYPRISFEELIWQMLDSNLGSVGHHPDEYIAAMPTADVEGAKTPPAVDPRPRGPCSKDGAGGEDRIAVSASLAGMTALLLMASRGPRS